MSALRPDPQRHTLRASASLGSPPMKSGGYDSWVGGEPLRLFTNEVWFCQPASSQPAEGGAVVTVTHVVTGPRSRLYHAITCTVFFQGAWFSCSLCIPSWLARGPVWF